MRLCSVVGRENLFVSIIELQQAISILSAFIIDRPQVVGTLLDLKREMSQ